MHIINKLTCKCQFLQNSSNTFFLHLQSPPFRISWVKGKVTYLQMSSSGSSSPNLSSKVSCIHTFSSSATNLHTSTVLRGYVCGNLGLWILPLVVTVIIFSWWGSCTPTGRTENRGINTHSFSFPKVLV